MSVRWSQSHVLILSIACAIILSPMATKKAAGSAKNISYNNPQYLGIKLYAGEQAKVGNIIVRQRGTRFMAGKNTRVAKDHSIFAMKNGTVSYRLVRKTKFDGSMVHRQKVDVA